MNAWKKLVRYNVCINLFFRLLLRFNFYVFRDTYLKYNLFNQLYILARALDKDWSLFFFKELNLKCYQFV